MSQRTYVTWCVAIVVLGVMFLVGNLLMDGFSVWDFLPILFASLGIIAVAQVRRNQR